MQESPAATIKVASTPFNYWWQDLALPPQNKPTADAVLSQMKQAGYAGTEVGDGSILPLEPQAFNQLLAKYGLETVGGFWPTYLLIHPFDQQEKAFAEALNILVAMHSDVVMVADFSYSVTDSLTESVFSGSPDKLKSKDWEKLGQGLAHFQKMARDKGLKFGFHPHLGTIVSRLKQLERLLDNAPDLTLNIDTGHLAAAGDDPLEAIDKYIDRTIHLHLKSIRAEVVKRTRKDCLSWRWLKINGAFTVPGDGKIDFEPIFERIKAAGYQGWVTLEIEQDPHKADPYLYIKYGRDYLREVAGW